MLFKLFEDKVRPGVASTQQEWSVTDVTILVLIKQGGQTWIQYPRMSDALAANRKKLLMVIITPGLTSFSSDKLHVIFLFSERSIDSTFSIKRVQQPLSYLPHNCCSLIVSSL